MRRFIKLALGACGLAGIAAYQAQQPRSCENGHVLEHL